MASSSSFRQAGRRLRTAQLHISSPVTRQHSLASSLLRSSTSRPKHITCIPALTHLQQNRSFSLWGSGNSSPAEKLDVPVIDPSDVEKTRTIQASHATSDSLNPAQTQAQAHPPSPIEPQIIEDIQTSIAEPHLSDPAAQTTPPNLEEIPERLGYLKEVCGLDFGWGPTSVMEWAIEHLHIVGGFSWATSCILLGVIFRASVAPLMISAARETAKMREMTPVTKPLMEKIQAARASGDTKLATKLTQELQLVRKTYNFKFSRAFLPMIVQLPFGFGAWRILRNAATLPVPGFVTETWLWTSDLSFSDPYFVMPALAGALVYGTLKINRAAQQTAANSDSGQGHFMNLMLKVFPILTTTFVAVQPGAVQLYIVSSSMVGLLTASVMANPMFRKAVKLPPLAPIPGPAATQEPVAKLPGGLKTRHHHVQMAKLQAASAAKTVERNPDRSIIDKVVDAGKDQWSSIKGNAKGMMSTFTEAAEAKKQKEKLNKQKELQARYREEFEARRKESELQTKQKYRGAFGGEKNDNDTKPKQSYQPLPAETSQPSQELKQ